MLLQQQIQVSTPVQCCTGHTHRQDTKPAKQRLAEWSRCKLWRSWCRWRSSSFAASGFPYSLKHATIRPLDHSSNPQTEHAVSRAKRYFQWHDFFLISSGEKSLWTTSLIAHLLMYALLTLNWFWSIENSSSFIIALSEHLHGRDSGYACTL